MHKGISGVFWYPRVLSSVNYTEDLKNLKKKDLKKMNDESHWGPKRPQKCLLRLSSAMLE